MALIWHLAHTCEWEEARGHGSYAVSTRGLTVAEVGFVHCAHAHQVESVASRFYADDEAPLTLLGVDTDRLGDAGIEVRDEPGDPAHPEGERFPHVYGPIPVAAVIETRDARVIDGALVTSGWPWGPGSGWATR